MAYSIGDALQSKLEESSFAGNIRNMDNNVAEIRNFLNTNLANIIHASIEASMKPVLQDISNAINKLNKSGLDGVAGVIKEGFGSELQGFAKTLNDTGDKLGSMIIGMKNMSKSMNYDLEATIKQVVVQLKM